MSNRHQLLRTLIDDPHTTPAEREAAQRELNTATGKSVSRNLLDDELESYLSPNPNLRSSDLVAIRHSLSQPSQQLLNDIGASILTLPPADGALERLKRLAESTHSPIVKERATAAIKVLVWMQERNQPCP